MNRIILSVFGVGYLRPAPGTWGSLAAFPAAWCAYLIAGPWALLVGIPLIYALGVWILTQEMPRLDDHDPSWVVIDEVVGQWIAILPVAFGAYASNLAPIELWPGLVAAFVAFRLFDIWKPWLVGRADRRGDPTGVMLDDVWAGVFAAIVIGSVAVVDHIVLPLIGTHP